MSLWEAPVGSVPNFGKNPAEDKPDMVAHPHYYNNDPSGVECLEVVRHRNFNVGNAMKYLWRNGLKDSDAQTQDLRKAIFYIEDEIARLDGLDTDAPSV